MKEVNTHARIGMAILKGWGIRGFRKAISPTSRHVVWIQKPNSEGWYCEKVEGTKEDWINALLDEAGIPR